MIIFSGGRGDIEPFAAMAQALASIAQWKVLVCVQKDYVGLIPSHENIQTFIFPFTLRSMELVFADPEATEAATAGMSPCDTNPL